MEGGEKRYGGKIGIYKACMHAYCTWWSAISLNAHQLLALDDSLLHINLPQFHPGGFPCWEPGKL